MAKKKKRKKTASKAKRRQTRKAKLRLVSLRANMDPERVSDLLFSKGYTVKIKQAILTNAPASKLKGYT